MTSEIELELLFDVITLRPPGLDGLTIAEAVADLLKYGRFMDDLRIYVKGGTGGMGYARLGGAGGKGGDVWLVADEKMTLKKMKDKYPKKRFVAEAGTNSSIAALKGNKGKDCEVNVPPGIIVTTENGKQLVTTLSPEIGTVMYPDHKQITVADLPGLIEGAHANKGRGHKFLKHVERTKQLLFVIDVSGFQLSSHTPFRTAFETIMLLAKELELYKEELQTKSAMLAVNKMDLPNAKENFEKLMEQLQKPQNYLHLLPQKMIPEVIVKFREIIPISAHTGEGSEQLITCLRKIIDQEAEEKIESYQREQLRALHLSKI
ncbi:GTP-binding protein 10, partial [Ophiophagus hannah]